MVLASSIWKQIAPWVFEDANATTPYRATPTQVTAPTISTTPAMSTTSSASKNVTNQITQPQTSNQKRLEKLRPSTQSATPTQPVTSTAPDRLWKPKTKVLQQPQLAPSTIAGQPWATIDPKIQYFDDVSKSIWYESYADYQAKTGQNLDMLQWMYDFQSDFWDEKSKRISEKATNEVAWLQAQIWMMKNQSEARILAMGTDIINWPDILKEQDKIGKLIDQWITDAMQIGQILGMDAKKVTDLINGKVEPYVTLSDEAYNKSNADNIERTIAYETQKYEDQKMVWYEQLRRLEEDFTKQYSEQQTQNKIADANLSILARMTWTGFSNRGIIGMDEIHRQWQRILSEMSTQYQRSSEDTRNYLQQLAQAYTYNNYELIDSLNKNIESTKNGYFKSIQSIKTQYWDATEKTEQQVRQAMNNFAWDMEKYYMETFDAMKQVSDLAQTQYTNAVNAENETYQRQQDTLTQYKDSALSMTPAQIMADTTLTPQQKQIAVAQQQSTAVATLWALSITGVARPQDIERVQTLLKNPNITPEMAIAQVVNSNPNLYWALAQQKASNKGVNKQLTTIEMPDWTKQSVIFDLETWTMTPVNTNYQTPNGVPIQDAIAIAISKCSTGAQCWKFVNDILEASGQPRLVKDSYDSKVQAIQTIWEAYSMEEVGAGSIFAYPVWDSPYWHIGIVTSINDDWTINIMDYNYNNDEQQRERLNVNPWEILNKWGLLSKPIIREDTVPEAQQEKVKKPLTKEEKSTLFSIQDDLKADPRRKEYLTLQSKIKTLDWIKSRLDTWKATAQDKQQLISDFAKVLDPTSVVREWEYALAAKYGQSKVNKTIQDISNWYSTNWPISDDSAKILAEAVWLRFEATQLANDEAVAEQKQRAEIFLWRPVSFEELAVTQKATAPTPTQSSTNDDPLWILQ